MDIYGIGNAMKSMIRVYLQSVRASGRTSLLIDNLKGGDRVIVMSNEDRHNIIRLCKERRIEITCIIINPKKCSGIFHIGPSQGRTIFDHRWIEQYYEYGMHGMSKNIDKFQKILSGYNEVHIKTKRQDIEACKWEMY